MLSRRTLLSLAAILGTLTCLIVWWAVRTVIAPAGVMRTQAVVQERRVEDTPTEAWRLYDRDRRYLIRVGWGDGEQATAADTEVSPFEFQRLTVGQQVPVFASTTSPPVAQLKVDAAYEVFLVVLGVGSMVASLMLIAVGLRLEDRVRDDDETA